MFHPILHNHQRIALQLSGGRDSLAALYSLESWWDMLTVYWVNTGNAFPETLMTMQHISKIVPRFQEIQGNQPKVVHEYGMPSDVLSVNSTKMGYMAGSKSILLQDRYTCCSRVMMEPMLHRMQVDKITLVIRGVRKEDGLQDVVNSGEVVDGVEYYYPIYDWDTQEVNVFLAERGMLPHCYTMMNTNPDCMECSAWWEDGRAAYMKKYHPEAYTRYMERLEMIEDSLSESIIHFQKEVKGVNHG